MIPADLKYTKEHEWVKVEGEEATIGITDYAQSELGDITFVELPNIGDTARRGGSVATVESVKAASDIYAPVSGRIAKVNDVLSDAPESINSSPYGDGWICKIKINDLSELNDLMDPATYEEFINTL